ncbi:MAG: DRTGG domain-containing protein [Eubacteriales bacterium]
MTVDFLEQVESFSLVNRGDELRPVEGIYCGDLLSMVMGRALENQLWITVMGNVNAIAVAVLTDVSAILLAEGCQLDEEAQSRAKSQGIWVFSTDLPTYEASMLVAEFI